MNCKSCGKQKFGPWTTVCTSMVSDPRYMEMYCRCAGGVYSSNADEYSRKDFEREFPELFKLWESAPIAMGLENSTHAWLEFAEYVRQSK